MKKILLVVLITISTFPAFSQCGGIDILIANDQSGSVDAQENIESRQFMVSFAQSLPLKYSPDGFRIAIADWDYQRGWYAYNFPSAGTNYTTSLSDIIAYANSPRILDGGTDLVLALQMSYQYILADSSDTRPKAIILLTDAAGWLPQPDLIDLANQIKNSGIYIAVVAIDDARFYPILQDVPSTGGYFSADNYQVLADSTAAYTASITNAACQGNQPAYNLSTKLTSFTADNCYPGPATYTLYYDIQNNGNKTWNDSVTISLYDNDPQQYGTNLITVFKTPLIQIDSAGVYQGSFNNIILGNHSVVEAIVNYDGTNTTIKIPAYAYELLPALTINGETSSSDNYSNLISLTNSPSCIPKSIIVTDIQADSIGCGGVAGYKVTICNEGDLDANISNLTPIADPAFTLLYAKANLDSTKTAYYNSYLGGANSDYAYGAAIDKFGYVYMSGQTNSSTKIATVGAWQTTEGGTDNAFLTKFDATGKIVWSTYYGGVGSENGYSVTTDIDGNIYLTGETSISTHLATVGAYQTTNAGSTDAYLAKFNSNGVLLWATYYGGAGADYGRSVITDKLGNVYLAGYTASISSIATTTASQPTLGGSNDAFLVKFNKDGVRQWATYYGGSGTETGFGLAVDSKNNIYLTGLTGSNNNISTVGIFQPIKNAGNDSYLVKFNSNGVRQWGTYFGGNGNDNATSLNIDRNDNIYIAGSTSSTTNISSTNAYQVVSGGGTDAFLAKFDTTGMLVWSTYYGGTGTESGRQVNTDNNNNVYLSGGTDSNNGIATNGVIQPTYSGNTDAYVAVFNENGTRQWGTYFGGTQSDIASASVTDAQGKAYIIGATSSLNIGTPYSYQQTYGGGTNDAFLLKIDQQSSFFLKTGNCVSLYYYYNASNANNNIYNFSYGITANKIYGTDPIPTVLPDSIGFDGTKHLSDNVSVVSNTPACTIGNKLSATLDIPATITCGTSGYVTATVTINNTSGLNIYNSTLQLNLSGSKEFFSSEIYNITNNLQLAKPNIGSPFYPNIVNALVNKNGNVSIPIYVIPSGTSSFKIDISTGIAQVLIKALITNVPFVINNSEQTDTAFNHTIITAGPQPSIRNWNFPTSINNGDAIYLTGISTINTDSLQWVSSTTGNLTNDGTLTNPSLMYQPTPSDIANGYVMLSLYAITNSGCDTSENAFIPINNVTYDYGDAPTSYDVNVPTTPIAAASTLLTGAYLGKLPPSTEPTAKSSTYADGDGVEEDGLIQRCPSKPKAAQQYKIAIAATNNTNQTEYINAFADWNNDGDYLDNGEKSIKQIIAAPQSGTTNYFIDFTIPPNIDTTAGYYFLRLRLSTDSLAIQHPFSPAPQGETEDHLLIIGEPSFFEQEINLCEGDHVSVGSKNYSQNGVFIDTLNTSSGCDSIITSTIKINSCAIDTAYLLMPTAFSPNGDGLNDVFKPRLNFPPSNFNLTIYNRWGNKVYETTDCNKGWNGNFEGQPQSTGAFIWYCNYVINGKPTVKKGTVVLTR